MERSSGDRTHAHARKAGGPQARLSTVVAFYYRRAELLASDAAS
jgi:hypothetical protein